MLELGFGVSVSGGLQVGVAASSGRVAGEVSCSGAARDADGRHIRDAGQENAGQENAAE